MDQKENETQLKEPAPGDIMSQERGSESGDTMSRKQVGAPGDSMSQERPSLNADQEEETGGQWDLHLSCGATKRRFKKLMARGVPYARALELCRHPLSPPSQETTSDPDRAPDSSQGAEGKRPQKRNRSEEASPRENPRKTTKLVTPARPSFKDVASAIKIGIKDQYKVLSDADLELVRASILGRIDVEAAKGGSGPRFNSCLRRDGWLCISCVDEHSRDWLTSRVGLLKPWRGARLTTILEKDFPKPHIGSIWVPGPAVDPKLILSRIRFQNSHMDCSSWRLLSSSRQEKGQFISFCMSRASSEELRRNGMTISMGFNPIAVKVRTPKALEPTTESTVPIDPSAPPTAPPGGQRPPNLSPTAERRAAPGTTPFQGGNADVFDPQVPGPSGQTQAPPGAPTAERRAAPCTTPFQGGNADVFDPQVSGPSGQTQAPAGARTVEPGPSVMAQAVAGDLAGAPRILGERGVVSGSRNGPADIRERPPLGRQGLGRAPSGAHQPLSSKPQRGAKGGGRGRGAFRTPAVRKPTQPKALGPPKR